MKKYFAGMVALGLAFSLTACGGGSPEDRFAEQYFKDVAPRKIQHEYQSANGSVKEEMRGMVISTAYEVCDTADRIGWKQLRSTFKKNGTAQDAIGYAMVEYVFSTDFCDD